MDRFTEITADGTLVMQLDEEKNQFYLGPNAFSNWIVLRMGLYAGTTKITKAVVFDFFHNYAPFVDGDRDTIRMAWKNFKRAQAQSLDQPRAAFFEFMAGKRQVARGYGVEYRASRATK